MGTKVCRFFFFSLSFADDRGFAIRLDYIEVANVISNYSAALIPLETMWTDIGKLSLLCRVYVSTHGSHIRLYVQAPDFHDGS